MLSLLRPYVGWQLVLAWILGTAIILGGWAAAQAQDAARLKPYVEPIPGSDVKFSMVPIPGGTFLMGSPKSESGTSRTKARSTAWPSSPFWMEQHEITWDEYRLWGIGFDLQRRTNLKLAAHRSATSWPTPSPGRRSPTPT